MNQRSFNLKEKWDIQTSEISNYVTCSIKPRVILTTIMEDHITNNSCSWAPCILQVTNYNLLQQYKIDNVIFHKCCVCNLIVQMDECLSMSSSRSQMHQALIMFKNPSSIEICHLNYLMTKLIHLYMQFMAKLV
jgi:hypothetical protein